MKFLQNKILAWLYLTDNCNFRCKYCYVKKEPKRMSTETIKDSIDQLIEIAKANSLKRIDLKLAGGEPLLALDLLEFIVDYVKQFDIEIKIFIITNGSLVTPKIVKFLKKNKVMVAISLDGLQKYHDKQRVFANGNGTFKSVMKGINTFIKLKYPKEWMIINIVVSKYNVDGLYEVTQFLLKNKFNFSYLLFKENKQSKLIKPSAKKIIPELFKCFNIIEEKMYPHLLMDILFDRINLARAPRTQNCLAGQCYVAISSDGRISTCPMIKPSKYSVQKKELSKFLKNEPTGISKFNINNVEECKDCHWRYICAGGCPAINYSKFGKLNKKSIYCKIYKAVIPRLIHLKLVYDSKFKKNNINR